MGYLDEPENVLNTGIIAKIFREQLLMINYSSRKAKTEAHGAYKYPRVANFGVWQVLSTP